MCCGYSRTADVSDKRCPNSNFTSIACRITSIIAQADHNPRSWSFTSPAILLSVRPVSGRLAASPFMLVLSALPTVSHAVKACVASCGLCLYPADFDACCAPCGPVSCSTPISTALVRIFTNNHDGASSCMQAAKYFTFIFFGLSVFVILLFGGFVVCHCYRRLRYERNRQPSTEVRSLFSHRQTEYATNQPSQSSACSVLCL